MQISIKAISLGLGLVLIIAGVALLLRSPNPSGSSGLEGLAQEQGSEVLDTAEREENPSELEAEVDVSSPGGGSSAPESSSIESSSAALAQAYTGIGGGQGAQDTAPAAPRQRADSPDSALKFFVQAMEADDLDRAASYFHSSVRANHRESFEGYSTGARHPFVNAYRTGEIELAKVVDPEQGLFEIAVYPLGSPVPFRARFLYDASISEWTILEL